MYTYYVYILQLYTCVYIQRRQHRPRKLILVFSWLKLSRSCLLILFQRNCKRIFMLCSMYTFCSWLKLSRSCLLMLFQRNCKRIFMLCSMYTIFSWLKLSRSCVLMLFQRNCKRVFMLCSIYPCYQPRHWLGKAFVVRAKLSCPNLTRSVAIQAFGLSRQALIRKIPRTSRPERYQVGRDGCSLHQMLHRSRTLPGWQGGCSRHGMLLDERVGMLLDRTLPGWQGWRLVPWHASRKQRACGAGPRGPGSLGPGLRGPGRGGRAARAGPREKPGSRGPGRQSRGLRENQPILRAREGWLARLHFSLIPPKKKIER